MRFSRVGMQTLFTARNAHNQDGKGEDIRSRSISLFLRQAMLAGLTEPCLRC